MEAMGVIEKTVEASDRAMDALRAASEAEGADAAPVVMINLLRYREKAAYSEGFAAEACSGREAYGRYGAVVLPLIGKAGGRILCMGAAQATVIGPAEEEWHDTVLVEYPSRKAFLAMLALPEYQAAAPHRSAALEDSRLIATSIQLR
jgi:uncharacterized protein (DUF1330 family)